MNTRNIGSLEVSAVGLGCNNFGWKIDQNDAKAVVDAALDAGIDFFDTAEMYDDGTSERMLGEILGARRKDVVLATKFGHRGDTGDGRPDVVRTSVEGSLRRLGTDVIDLYYLHMPDPKTPVADTLGALAELVEAGKVREVACSNFSAEQLREAARTDAGTRFVAVQNEFNLLERAPAENGVLDACEANGIAFVPYFPLKSGLLTGKYTKGDVPEKSRLSGDSGAFSGMGAKLLTDENLDVVEALRAFAEERGHSLLDLAFAWLLAHDPVASVIAGATSPEQVAGNARAAQWTLSDAELEGVRNVLSATRV